eukprot:SM000306S11751  [mRNA]  locus=s306:11611:13850:- [translate_table: standard]
MTPPVEAKSIPFHASPRWFRKHFLKHLENKRRGIVLLRGLDSRLAEDLPLDLQKLRCKVAFHALRYVPGIQAAGEMLAQRLWRDGPYLAVHLRLERDVWIRTGCSPGLGAAHDAELQKERERNPQLLKARANLTQEERKAAGLCPLTVVELVRLLQALGASQRTRIFLAGGEPYGGAATLAPLLAAYPHISTKESLAALGELEPFVRHASMLAAIDTLVCLLADVFLPSHGGNMGHVIQGARSYAGHRKHITPNKREIIRLFREGRLTPAELETAVAAAHADSLGQPQVRFAKGGRDVTAYPVPECMCQGGQTSAAHPPPLLPLIAREDKVVGNTAEI